MKKTILTFLTLTFTFISAQESQQLNSYQQQFLNLSKLESGLTIGGYGEVTYNNYDSGPSELDVQRLVMLFAYKFDDRVSFITEVEYEHVKEVYIEQAWLNYALTDNTNLRAGLLLVPMGIVNEYHEPTTFNGVERPTLITKLFRPHGEKLEWVYQEGLIILIWDIKLILWMVPYHMMECTN